VQPVKVLMGLLQQLLLALTRLPELPLVQPLALPQQALRLGMPHEVFSLLAVRWLTNRFLRIRLILLVLPKHRWYQYQDLLLCRRHVVIQPLFFSCPGPTPVRAGL
jgi:hypothetical protein